MKAMNTITAAQIRTRLTESIKESGLTQKEIAQRLNITQQSVSCYATGKKMPSLDTFANLCRVLDADPAYILCIKEY